MIKPWIRQLLFWSFFTFFIIAAPISVLYTAGYRYNFSNGQIVRTGVISINSTPRNARIYLDGEDTEKTTPYIFKRLMPAVYQIAVWREGYHSWEGSVEVKSGETSLVQPIQLFLDSQPELVLKQELLHYAAYNQQIAFLTQGGGWSEIWLYDLESNEPKKIEMKLDSIISDEAEIAWSASGQSFFVFDAQTGYLNVFNSDGQSKDLTLDLQDETTNVFWHPSDNDLLYLAQPETLYQVDLASGLIRTYVADEAASVLLDASILTFKDNGTNVEIHQSFDDEEKIIALLPRNEYTVAERDGGYLILTSNKNDLYLLNIHEDQPILLGTKATHFDWLAAADILVYSDGMEVNLYDAPSHRTTFITRQGDTIEDIFWHPSGVNLILVTKNKVSTIERYRVGKQRTSTTLLENAEIQSFWITNTGENAYFYGTFGEDIGIFALPLID